MLNLIAMRMMKTTLLQTILLHRPKMRTRVPGKNEKVMMFILPIHLRKDQAQDEVAMDEAAVGKVAMDEAAVDEVALDAAAVDAAAVDEAAVDEAAVGEVDGGEAAVVNKAKVEVEVEVEEVKAFEAVLIEEVKAGVQVQVVAAEMDRVGVLAEGTPILMNSLVAATIIATVVRDLSVLLSIQWWRTYATTKSRRKSSWKRRRHRTYFQTIFTGDT